MMALALFLAVVVVIVLGDEGRQRAGVHRADRGPMAAPFAFPLGLVVLALPVVARAMMVVVSPSTTSPLSPIGGLIMLNNFLALRSGLSRRLPLLQPFGPSSCLVTGLQGAGYRTKHDLIRDGGAPWLTKLRTRHRH